MMSPPRALYVWDADYPWDVRVHKVCRSLVTAGYQVRILARNRNWLAPREAMEEGEVVRMRPWRMLGKRLDSLLGFPAFFNPRWLALLNAEVRRERPDVLIVRDLPLCPTALWVARRAGIPVILDMAENYPAMIQLIWETGQARWYDWLVRNPTAVAAVERYVLPRVSRVWVDVEEQGERLRSLGVAVPPIDVVRNTPPMATLPSEPVAESTAAGALLEVVYLGLFEIQRGIGELLEAGALLRRAGHPVRIVLVGGGRDEMMFRRQAAGLDLGPDQVEFTGFLPHDEALARVARADVGVNPIHRNAKHDTTLPNKLFDYMAAGLPVLTSDSMPSARVVQATGCGAVFRSGDPADLVRALLPLLDAATRFTMGRRGRAAVVETYHWERDAATVVRSLNALRRRHETAAPAE